jgi:hypothetical protein
MIFKLYFFKNYIYQYSPFIHKAHIRLFISTIVLMFLNLIYLDQLINYFAYNLKTPSTSINDHLCI